MEDLESQTASTQENKDVNAIFKKAANRPITLKFEDVVYKIKIPKTSTTKGRNLLHFLKKSSTNPQNPETTTTEKEILKGITGLVQPSEMLAMLGPSGSGKTTLLTALGGRLGGKLLTGTVTYNGSPFSTHLKRSIGFVTQDDILYEHLTVTETLVYTALLRLPKSLTKQEKIAHAEAVIVQLGLQRCKNSVIGGPFVRGVSGGERKRVSIGQEMLINPSLLLLDEPTSGLDSTTAVKIVSTLAGLAVGGGRTVVMTIHQPSSKLFYMFNKVLLLSEGNPLYFGDGGQVMGYFESIGFAPSVAMNPADFLLDLANGMISPPPDEEEELQDQVAEMKLRLVSKYKECLENKVKLDIRQVLEDDEGVVVMSTSTSSSTSKWATTWWQQFIVLLERGVKERKHESFSKLNICQVISISLLVSLLWFKSDVSHLQDQVGLLFFITAFWGFYPLFQAIFTFPPEHFILAKERSSGMYRLSSYFISRTVGDLPMELVLPTIFLIIVYWATSLKPTAAAFFYSLISLLLSVLVSQGLGLALGAVFLKLKNASVLGSVLMLTFMMAGGFYLQHVPRFISWVKYLSVLQYTFKLMLGSQYDHGQTYRCDDDGGVCQVEDFPTVMSVGLDQQWVAWLAMIVMLVGYRFIAYVALMRVGTPPK